MGMYVLITITLCGQVFGKIEEHESEHEMDIADLRLHGQKPSCRQKEDIDSIPVGFSP